MVTCGLPMNDFSLQVMQLLRSIVIWRFDVEKMLTEKILAAPVTVLPATTVSGSGNHDKVKILVCLNQRVDKPVC